MPDIDIDFLDRNRALDVIKHIRASRLDDSKLVAHNTGIYLQTIPCDPITNLSGIEYKEAEDRGYFKIDFLNVNIYKGIRDESHLTQLMETEPLWDLLEQDDFMTTIWTKPEDGEYYFKKAHAVAYAMAIVVQMNLICEQISYGYS